MLLNFLFSITVLSLLYTVSLDLLRVDGVRFGCFAVFRSYNFMKLGWLGYLGTSQTSQVVFFNLLLFMKYWYSVVRGELIFLTLLGLL